MNPRAVLLCLSLSALAAPIASRSPVASEPRPGPSVEMGDGSLEPFVMADIVWDATAAEHLLNRAGFGARPAEIERAVALGREAVVRELLAERPEVPEPYFALRLSNRDGGEKREMERMGLASDELDSDAKQALTREMRKRDARQMIDYGTLWIEGMQRGVDPLRDRMTLFWHGFFTTSFEDVKSSYLIIRQHEFLRENALGSYRDLLHGIARDPAMLEYLDNRSNRKKSPNENFAREVMELFTLGEGNYTELDVKEAARAFTGWTTSGGDFLERRSRHDRGVKRVLGRRGRFDGTAVLDMLIDEPACARYVAGRILAYLEGVPTSPERLERYADLLRAEDYELTPLLEALFADPVFYGPEVVGARIAGPVDFMVGTSRRMGIQPSPRLVYAGAQSLGQRLFFPPNVKGWEGGEAWITTSTMMMRGNLAGVLLGRLDIDDVVGRGFHMTATADPRTSAAEPGQNDSMDGSMDDSMSMEGGAMAEEPMKRVRKPKPRLSPGMRGVENELNRGWRPRLNLSARLERAGAVTDAEIVDTLLSELLAVEAALDTRSYLVGETAMLREEAGLLEGELTVGEEEGELALRRLAHLILCTPEAQLN
jgi:hypothetical protein